MVNAPSGPLRCKAATRPSSITSQSSRPMAPKRARKAFCTRRPTPHGFGPPAYETRMASSQLSSPSPLQPRRSHAYPQRRQNHVHLRSVAAARVWRPGWEDPKQEGREGSKKSPCTHPKTGNSTMNLQSARSAGSQTKKAVAASQPPQAPWAACQGVSVVAAKRAGHSREPVSRHRRQKRCSELRRAPAASAIARRATLGRRAPGSPRPPARFPRRWLQALPCLAEVVAEVNPQARRARGPWDA